MTLDPHDKKAFSYGWWQFLAIVNGAVVFNNYRYSPSTGKHQHKVRSKLADLGIHVDLFINSHTGLQDSAVGLDALRSAYRDQDFDQIKRIKQVFKVTMSQDEIAALYVDMEESLCNEFLHASVRRQELKELNEFNSKCRILQNFLENDCAFRDYEIYSRKAFGDSTNPVSTKIAVHQCVDLASLEQDVENALQTFTRDGFPTVVFYV